MQHVMPHFAAPTCSSVRPDSSRLSRDGTACTASSVEAGANRWAFAAEAKEVVPEAMETDTDRASSDGVGVAEPLWVLCALRGRAPPASAFSGVRGYGYRPPACNAEEAGTLAALPPLLMPPAEAVSEAAEPAGEPSLPLAGVGLLLGSTIAAVHDMCSSEPPARSRRRRK